MPRKTTNQTTGSSFENTASMFQPKKNQGYQLPLELWQQLHEEAGRRKRLGLPYGTQNAIACAALEAWLGENKGDLQ